MSTMSRITCTTVEASVSMLVLGCVNCGMTFGITSDFERKRREDHQTFYCPVGHPQIFPGQSETDVLREQIRRERKRNERIAESRDAARQLAQSERRRAAAAKGQVTKMRNRVARGECPMPACGQSFSDLHAHVTEQHPELSEMVEQS